MREVVVVGAGLHRYGVFPRKNALELSTVAIQRALEMLAVSGQTLRPCTAARYVWGCLLGTTFVGTWERRA